MRNFKVGDRVAPEWDQTKVGTVTELECGGISCQPNMVVVNWDDEEFGRRYGPRYHFSNVVLVGTNMIKLKPIQSEAEISGGFWTHVVLNSEGKIVSAFVCEEDADEYVERQYDDSYTVRAVQY